MFDSSVLHVAEVVAETFSGIWCPVALMLGTPQSPSHVLAVGSWITYMYMVKHLLKVKKKRI
jgi:hypothetical protein